MAEEIVNFSICSSRLPRKETCDSRLAAMSRLDANIKRAQTAGGSAGMLDSGRWELHFPNQSMILNWVEDSFGDVQRFP